MKAISEFKEHLRYVNNYYIKHRYYEAEKLGELASEFWKVCDANNIEYDDTKLSTTNSYLLSIKNDCLEIRAKLAKMDLNDEEKRIYEMVDYTLLNFFHFNERDLITKDGIIKKAFELKDNGFKNSQVFESIKTWLFDELGYDNKQLKHRFRFELKDIDLFTQLMMNSSLFKIKKAFITKETIVKKAYELKNKGTKNPEVFDKIKEWLFIDYKFDNQELKSKFGFELNDYETFRRFRTKNIGIIHRENRNRS